MKVLITNKVHEVLINGLKRLDYDVDYKTNTTNESIRNIINQYDGIIINSNITADRALIDKGKKLKFIGRLGSGLEIIDVAYAAQHGIDVFNSPGGNCNAVAEQALGMLLCFSNNIIRANHEVKQFIWRREANRGFEISGKSIGIVGFGHTGRAFAQKLHGWDVDIFVYDKYLATIPERYSWVIQKDIEYIQKNCDIISFHLPLSVETKHFFNYTFLEGCEKEVIIVNTSRGQVIDTHSLLLGLREGKIKGACLDVFENEKPDTHTHEEKEAYRAIYNFPQVITSPHIAGWTDESLIKIASIVLDKIKHATAYY